MSADAGTSPPGTTLRRRVTVAGLVGVVVLLLAGGVIAERFVTTVLASRDVLTRLQPAADASRELTLAFSDAEGYVSDAVLDGFTRTTPRTAAGADCVSARACYEQSWRRAQTSLTAVRGALGAEPAIQALADRTAAAANRWQDVDPVPTFASLGLGDVDAAAAITRSLPAQESYTSMIGAAQELQDAIDDQRAAAESELGDFARELAAAMALGAVLLLAVVVVAYLLLRRWVLAPLDAVRAQLRAVAAGGDTGLPIAPSGPPELAAVALDAEAMRRRLVSGDDEVRAAREALDQQGPVVAEIRTQLAGIAPEVPGLRLHGTLSPAEGVLAGDFWSMEALPDGRVAVVVADVSGHGPDAGVTALRVRTVVSVVLAAGFGPEAALARAASTFRDAEGRFATVAVAVVDPGSGEVEWANAGHHPPLLLRDADGNGRPDAGEPVEHLVPTGPLLSSLGGSWVSHRTVLGPGEVLVAWTDGLTESHDLAGVELGEDGLLDLLDTARHGRHGVDAAVDPVELVERVMAAARRRAVDWRRDDVTLVVVSRAPA